MQMVIGVLIFVAGFFLGAVCSYVGAVRQNGSK